MKKTLITILAAGALVASSFGQGTVNFAFSTGANTVKLNGVSATSGNGVRVELLWAPLGTTDITQFQVLGAFAAVGTPVAGYFSGGNRTIPAGTGFGGIAPGAVVSLAVRGWQFSSGATYDVAVYKAITPIFSFDTADPTAQPAPEAPSNLNTPFPGLNIPVPEPSSMALAGLGAASMLIFRRRK